MDTEATLGLMSKVELKLALDCSSNTTIAVYVEEQLITPPVQQGDRRVAWPRHEIAAILDARAAGADRETIRALVRRLMAERAARLASLKASLEVMA